LERSEGSPSDLSCVVWADTLQNLNEFHAIMPSSVIRHFNYDPRRNELTVLFITGRRYTYHGVPADLAEEMQSAFSKGEFFNARIRDHFRFTRLEDR
jgi:KTSC domain